MANKVEAILEEIKGLTLLEAADLVKKMEETFGVSAAAAAAETPNFSSIILINSLTSSTDLAAIASRISWLDSAISTYS